MNTTAKILSILSVLLVAVPSAQANLRAERTIDYGEGISMKQYTDNADFVMSVKDGPTFKFDSSTQTVLITRPDGSVQVVDFNK
jgi:hypothetical protein